MLHLFHYLIVDPSEVVEEKPDGVTLEEIYIEGLKEEEGKEFLEKKTEDAHINLISPDIPGDKGLTSDAQNAISVGEISISTNKIIFEELKFGKIMEKEITIVNNGTVPLRAGFVSADQESTLILPHFITTKSSSYLLPPNQTVHCPFRILIDSPFTSLSLLQASGDLEYSFQFVIRFI
jgi:hypothetical protein